MGLAQKKRGKREKSEKSKETTEVLLNFDLKTFDLLFSHSKIINRTQTLLLLFAEQMKLKRHFVRAGTGVVEFRN